ncbi:hypothetical protein PTSG_01412 [Salpingoeca rosetta]|uniref:Uncharacterized protein n=1 Tax=Salpingoeca rosetta (strain ATCC 50818 / BSB-021) TaxID=946362 RepID=F2U098_SALR5|nr:uncharacterized protein PTSG_01412 [Salpingoeca rosetta]EGD80826.1 hypothetical protein PTSG_01412 [Salpingoeca rosetta]|eukprot:XP_004997387.1 hypothetical protein PTSG_01412 [Salpingoeca rosetta]
MRCAVVAVAAVMVAVVNNADGVMRAAAAAAADPEQLETTRPEHQELHQWAVFHRPWSCPSRQADGRGSDSDRRSDSQKSGGGGGGGSGGSGRPLPAAGSERPLVAENRGESIPVFAADSSATFTAGTVAWRKTEMLFGLSVQNKHGTTVRNITEAEFERFMALSVLPRFPNGTTVTNATGSYLSRVTHTDVRERSKYLLVYHPDTPVFAERIQAITQDYMRDYQQESVLYTSIPATVCFSDCGCVDLGGRAQSRAQRMPVSLPPSHQQQPLLSGTPASMLVLPGLPAQVVLPALLALTLLNTIAVVYILLNKSQGASRRSKHKAALTPAIAT